MIEYRIEKIKPFGDDREVKSFQITPSYESLSIIQALTDVDDLDYFIEWLKDLLDKDVADFSEGGALIYVHFQWGSHKSRIVDLNKDGSINVRLEFYTADLLQLCEAWRKFLVENPRS